MRFADYIATRLLAYGVSDAFGIPGGVILELIYALDRTGGKLRPHLCYHEQSAAFAACGYAQSSGKLGVAYATRGPGITNMLTSIADAYIGSIPVLFITAHSARKEHNGELRMEHEQEIDIVSMVKNITKYAAEINDEKEMCSEVEKACALALNGRNGPVLLDILSSLFEKDVQEGDTKGVACLKDSDTIDDEDSIVHTIVRLLDETRRPVLLVGDGIRHARIRKHIHTFVRRTGIPILSSRVAQDILSNEENYFGYIGSHGTRYGNFILSKADAILSLGNRLAFPLHSKSFQPIIEHARIVRIDVDDTEFKRHIPNSETFAIDLHAFAAVLEYPFYREVSTEWLHVCRTLKEKLTLWDNGTLVRILEDILQALPQNAVIVTDVGNHEFLVSLAYEKSCGTYPMIHSKSFGALGGAIGKAIGVFYATGSPVMCFIGDQGFQMNIQEIQYLVQHHLPIGIVLINNHSSGMILDRELKKGYSYPLHTTKDSGYLAPNFLAIAKAYGLKMSKYCIAENKLRICDLPMLLEVCVDPEEGSIPYLPFGAPCAQMSPPLPTQVYRMCSEL